MREFYKDDEGNLKEEENQIVVDYIASMTDDYFIDLYTKTFPNSEVKVDYRRYFK
jgi:dGTPase